VLYSERVTHARATTAEEVPHPRADSSQTSFRHSIFFIVLVALILRLAVITVGHTYRITPRRDHFQFGWEMGRLARSIALGRGFSSPTDLESGPSAWTAPVYPYILAGVFKVFGIYTHASAWIILAFNSIFDSLTCWTLYLIAGRMYGAWVARGTAWTWAVFPYLIYWPVRVVWEQCFTTFFLTVVLLFTIRMAEGSRRWNWVIYGLLWGLILLTNTTLVILLPFLLAWLLWKAHPRPFSGAAVAITIIVLCAVPWTLRNYHQFHKFILIRDNLPLEMHEANNNASIGLWTRNEHPGNDPASMRRFQELGEIRFMDEKNAQVQQFIRENPGRFLLFTLKRVWYFWAAPPQATIVAGYDLWVARHVQFLLAALFAFAGLVLTFLRNSSYRWLLAPFLLIYPLPYYIVNPFPRYKHPIEPIMLILTVYVLWEAKGVRIELPLLRSKRQERFPGET
jgi:4-amino-4-deoxy-L-arabinose transferase-like glycosyltransferase